MSEKYEVTDLGATEYGALVRDARRYRWLRDAPCGSGVGEVEILLWDNEAGVIANDKERDLDAAIDAAMEAANVDA